MQLQLDSAAKADYVKGFKEGFKVSEKDKKEVARRVGQWFGMQYGTQFAPYFNTQLFGTDSTQTMSKKDFLSGYLAAVVNDSNIVFTMQDAQTYSMGAMEAIKKATTEKLYGEYKKENEEWLEKNKSAEGVQVTASGLQYKVVTEGTGPKPAETDRVKVTYKGTNINDEVFDSTTEGEPREFQLNSVIKGWTEGMQLMPTGSTYLFYIPAELAYGEQERGEFIKPFSTLIFEVELLEIVK
jgi:FKBP-type peptidyl-prolyl cis-trans isomerase FklB